MKITWDAAKADSNFRKHKIRFSDAEAVLFDPMALTIEDETEESEQRFLSVGADALNRVVVVVYTYREGGIRLISARRATQRERKAYEEGIQF
ncbi:MAG: BrnT family toxin [Deltaproteobacteria bacterium]|nr:BrnT family toxin [Deltaproteobacteria bacterium]